MIENLGNKRVLTEAEQTMYDDWHKSGIDDNTIMSYVNAGLLKAHGDYWELFYPQKNNTPNEYYTQRFYNNCKNKYIRPKGKESQIFIPLGLHNSINNKDDYLIITEGEKKAIKASLEGFNCVAIPGVYCWKRNPLKQEELKDKTVAQIEEILDEEDYPSDIISSLSEMQLKGKPIYLCFDNDVMTKEMVKEALLMLSGYLIGEKEAIVKIIYLPQSEDKLGLDDYLIKYGKEDFTRLLEKAQTVTLKSIQNDMMGVKNTKNKFPMDIFEDDLKNQIEDVQERLDAPIEYIAMAVLGGAAVIMNGKYSILVNPISGWTDSPILWIAIVGEPSRKKSPCLNFVKHIIDDLEVTFEDDYNTKMKKYKKELNEYKSKLKSKEDIGELEPPEIPQRQRMTTQDTTVEAIVRAILKNSADSKRGISIWTDELSMFLLGMGQYKSGGKNNDETYFLQSWNKQRFNVMRSTSDIDYIIYPAHSIIGTIQPKVLDKTIFSSNLGGENGFMERWLYVLTDYVETGIQSSKTTPLDNKVLKDIYTRLFKQTVEKEYKFSQDAQKCFNQFNYEIVQKKNKQEIPEIMKSYLQKHTQYVARFALVLHCIKDPNKIEIDKETVKKAISLSNYFIKTYETIVIKKANNIDLVEETYTKLLFLGKNSISPTKLYKMNMSKYKSVKNAKIILEHLQHRAYGRMVKASNGCKFKLYKYN